LHEVGAIRVDAVGPNMCAVFGVDQLRIHAHPVTMSWTPKMRQLAKVKPCP
jgi:hypothetical protein